MFGATPVFIQEITTPVFPDTQTAFLDVPNVHAQIEKAEKDAEAARVAALAPVAVIYVEPVKVSYSVSEEVSGGLVGSIGYASAGGNCVLEPGVNNPMDGTNPISWSITSHIPWIGATVLFTWNHTGVVSGVYSDGSIEVRHQNCAGCPTHYYMSSVRGFR